MPQTITPYLLYEDVATMLDWLSRAFGLTEKLRFNAEDGSVNHAEMQIGDGAIFPGRPRRRVQEPEVRWWLARAGARARRRRGRPLRAGPGRRAEIRLELHDTEYGDRRYDAYDPEGHLWSFATHVRDLAASEWGAKEA